MPVTDVDDLIQTSLLGEAVENAPVAVFVADEDMQYIAVNRAAAALLGYDREELLGLPVDKLSPLPDAADRYRELVKAGRRSGRAQALRKDGSRVEVEYWSCMTQVAQMTVYVSFVRAL